MVITVQQYIKQGYPRLLRYALVATLAIVIVMFLVWPAYVSQPYTLEEEILEVVEIPADIEIPPPPQEAEMPKVPVQIEISETASDEETIEDTSFADVEDIPPPAATSFGGGPKQFYAFDEPPAPTYRQSPRYPEMAREAEMEGVVMVLIFVDERGNVFNVQVLSSSVPQILIDEAIAAAWKWRFKPGKQRNVPVKTTISVPFEFRVRGH